MRLAPIEPMLKAHGTKRLKLSNDEAPSKSAFEFNLRSYNLVKNNGESADVPVNEAGGVGISSTQLDAESPPTLPPHVRMSIHREDKSCSDFGRVLVLITLLRGRHGRQQDPRWVLVQEGRALEIDPTLTPG